MLTNVLLSIVHILDNHSIPYMIIGGYAALYHGHARFTEGIDIVLGVDIDEFDEIFKAVGSKFTPRAENPKSFAQKTNVFPIIGRQEDVRVDLIF